MSNRKMYGIVILLFLVDLLSENYVISLFHQKLTGASELLTILILMSIQICLAPVQAAASDHFTRKRTIYVALLSNLLCIVVSWFCNPSNHFQFWVVPLLIFFKSALGNLIPVGLAAVSDIHTRKYRKYFLGTTATYAISFILIRYVISTFDLFSFSVFLSILILVTIVLTRFHFFDIEDRTSDVIPFANLHNKQTKSWVGRQIQLFCKIPSILTLIFKQANKDRQNLIADVCDKNLRAALLGYFWWEVSMYSMIVSVVDLNFFAKFPLFPAFMMGGFLFGAFVVFTLASKWSDKRVITWGYYISALSLIPFFIFVWLGLNTTFIIGGCYFFHAAGNAFLSAAFMSFLAAERPHHVQGRTYGLIDSADGIAFMIGTVVGLICIALGLSITVLIIFSFLSFLFSFKYYKRFRMKHEKEQ
ncbi:MAG: MFS transporter [Halobacteriovoraceae bacterium]|nr:MFS transporter [Halobacteriovoraceae bacterium]